LSDFLACVVIQRNDVLRRCPINTHQPSSFFVHHALSAAWRHLLARVDRARKQCEPRRNPSLFLYWRSQAQSPHWALVTAVSQGHESERGAPQKILAAQEPHGCSRRIGSARKIASFGPSPVGGARVVSLCATPRALPRHYLPRGRVEDVQEPSSLACPIQEDWRTRVAERDGVHPGGESEHVPLRDDIGRLFEKVHVEVTPRRPRRSCH
jgi:hypothetical protein